MSYNITYDPQQKKRYPAKRKPSKGPYRAAVLLLLAALALLLANPRLSKPLRNFLLPGDPQVTKTAIDSMAEDLRTGESLGDAVTAFCREIIHGT